MGWTQNGGLDTAEKKLISSIGKTRHAATSGHQPVDRSVSPIHLGLSDEDDDDDKENQCSKSNGYRNNYLIESSDDDFDQCDSKVQLVVSSDDDSSFETFLQRVKTPNTKPKKISESGSEDSLKNFIVDDHLSDDDFIETKLSFKVPKKSNTPAAKPPSRRPLSQWDCPVFVSDSDDDDNIVVKKCSKEPPVFVPPVKGLTTPASKSLGETPKHVKTPGKSTILKPTVSQTEPRHGPTSRLVLCKTPGCFLESLSNPGSSYTRSFKQNKEDLTSKLYRLYNSSVFDNKLPVNMSVTWNKKMRKTAGYCITGQERGGGNRYARIELSEKVCDSADRLRDTLIHEMCHAATWLINGVRDGHGNFWKLYARKATVVHPELPMVTRCHSYDIKYKFQYQCTRCQNTIGRHSKSLDTQKFVCALCTGQLVLLTSSKSRAPTPFANFVKENYGSVRQELAGQSHAEVMRKLSADFASKTKLSQS
ncbi:acidic repeat-containing protein-like protein [Lates japonicus]|uniref:Acidic repeat-containing protein-like protein n=1 Tax=Lates japonicus TaxID=270547 RepID=A0AAD3MY98_LATJO|nr:acidic repeat-containing protein-like protein [Lates japonicus]